jgi:acetyl esterase/lipase
MILALDSAYFAMRRFLPSFVRPRGGLPTLAWLLTSVIVCAQTAPLPDLASVAPDLVVPAVEDAEPAAGHRVWQQAPGWQNSGIRHTLYLPTDWRADARLPVLVEWPGNGGYRNAYGDTCDGLPEGCRLGYGASGGRGFLWLCLPFVEAGPQGWRPATRWWGDLEASKRYCIEAVREACARFGGDPERVVLCGFSRGSIACNHLGLHDDTIAGLWRAFLCHSHYDGVRAWPYPDSDRASALQRLARLRGRPQFIIQEAGGTAATEAWLHASGVEGDWTFVPLPFRNHSDAWVLRDLPERRQLRAWLARVLAEPARGR